MVKKTGILFHEADIQLLACSEHILIGLTARQASNVIRSRPAGPEDIVSKGEESIWRYSNDGHWA